jgi:hypothetical protein
MIFINKKNMRRIVRLTESDLTKLVKRIIKEAHFDDVDVDLDDLKKQDNIVFLKQKEGYEQRRKGQFDEATLVIKIEDIEQVSDYEWTFQGTELYRVFDNHFDEPTVKEIDMGGIKLRVKLRGEYPEIYSVGSHVVKYEPIDEEDGEKIVKMCEETDEYGQMDKISKYDVGNLEGMGSMFESKMYRRKYRK